MGKATLRKIITSSLKRWERQTDCPLPLVHAYWKEKIAAGVDFRSLVQYDLVHPTVAGYRLMAEAIMKLFA
jgi:lysophospholipase L1-like esterase